MLEKQKSTEHLELPQKEGSQGVGEPARGQWSGSPWPRSILWGWELGFAFPPGDGGGGGGVGSPRSPGALSPPMMLHHLRETSFWGLTAVGSH